MGWSDGYGAIADCTKYIKFEPNSILAYYLRGMAKTSLNDYAGAIADCTKLIEIDPKSGQWYFTRGLLKNKLGQKESGCLDLRKAGELGYSEAYNAMKELCK